MEILVKLYYNIEIYWKKLVCWYEDNGLVIYKGLVGM